ncbi:hypothetical protein LY76DRAFT_255142 [Colletotrichum caudatum]|nr:hypothetical protein LY76DRAFT_255142 [Colletotrichum caudatum]
MRRCTQDIHNRRSRYQRNAQTRNITTANCSVLYVRSSMLFRQTQTPCQGETFCPKPSQTWPQLIDQPPHLLNNTKDAPIFISSVAILHYEHPLGGSRHAPCLGATISGVFSHFNLIYPFVFRIYEYVQSIVRPLIPPFHPSATRSKGTRACLVPRVRRSTHLLQCPRKLPDCDAEIFQPYRWKCWSLACVGCPVAVTQNRPGSHSVRACCLHDFLPQGSFLVKDRLHCTLPSTAAGEFRKQKAKR